MRRAHLISKNDRKFIFILSLKARLCEDLLFERYRGNKRLRRRETGGPFRKGALEVECAGRLSSTDCHRSKLLAGQAEPRRAASRRADKALAKALVERPVSFAWIAHFLALETCLRKCKSARADQP